MPLSDIVLGEELPAIVELAGLATSVPVSTMVSRPQWVVKEGNLDGAKANEFVLVVASPIGTMMPWCMSIMVHVDRGGFRIHASLHHRGMWHTSRRIWSLPLKGTNIFDAAGVLLCPISRHSIVDYEVMPVMEVTHLDES